MKFLIVVDMQKDFIDGSLGSTDAQSIVSKVKEKIEQYKKNGDAVVYTVDTHTEDYLETLEGKGLPVKHCIEGTDGWLIDESLGVNYDDDYIIKKSTFGALQLGDLLGRVYNEYCSNLSANDDDCISPNVESIEFVGLCTDICVVSNALIAKATFNIPIILDAQCCAGVTPEKHKAAIEVMKSCQVQVINEN